MPNIWTHMLFCEDVVDAIGHPESIPKHSYILNLGAQGPDPFFYYNFWPWIKDEPVHQIGNLLHTKKCGDFLMDLIISAKDKSEEIKSYVLAFMTHHILDRNTHPYVHYRAGYDGNKHQKLEVIIDTLMMERYKNLKTWKTPVSKEIHLTKHQRTAIADFLHPAIVRHYPEIAKNSSGYIKKAFQDMKLAQKLLADPYGWKNKLFKSLVSSYSYQPITVHTDYLNVEHKTWRHSATNEPSLKSFIDLYEQARIEAIGIMKYVLDFWSNRGSTRSDLEEIIGDISYDTGLPLQLDLQNKFSEPIV
ncbi:zinc dependent phospholipase C family protein [Ornithinibacillus contaminans]|uniref:zinc dependent phospholipase C family protein n=1 Tax=Ornithinibacillus contaminans TaxID=694055 RepID=UPI00064DC024|nr:zinc dependent phospholipase C family protein [Ornithinibacillus contaminans]